MALLPAGLKQAWARPQAVRYSEYSPQHRPQRQVAARQNQRHRFRSRPNPVRNSAVRSWPPGSPLGLQKKLAQPMPGPRPQDWPQPPSFLRAPMPAGSGPQPEMLPKKMAPANCYPTRPSFVRPPQAYSHPAHFDSSSADNQTRRPGPARLQSERTSMRRRVLAPRRLPANNRDRSSLAPHADRCSVGSCAVPQARAGSARGTRAR